MSTWFFRLSFVASRIILFTRITRISLRIRTLRIKKHLNKDTDRDRVMDFAIFFHKRKKKGKIFSISIFYFARQDRYDGVSEWYTTAFTYCEIVRMRIVCRQRGWYCADEIRCRLLGPVRISVHEFLCNEFFHARLDGRCAGAEAFNAHYRQNVTLVLLCLERHCDDVLV